MKIPIVPVIIKQRKPGGEVETIDVKNLFAVPILMCQHDGDLCDTLAFEPRMGTMINEHMHLLTLSPDREPGAVIYETYIEYVDHKLSTPGVPDDEARPDGPVTHVGRGGVTLKLGAGAHDKSTAQGANAPTQPVSRPTNDGGEQVAGGDAARDGEAVSSGSGEPEQRS